MAANDTSRGERCAVALIVSGVVLGWLAAALLLAWVLPRGVRFEWEWPWRDRAYPFPVGLLVVPVLFAGITFCLLRLLRAAEPRRWSVAGLLALCCVGAGVTMVLMEAAEPSSLHLAGCVTSPPATGYYAHASAQLSLRSVFDTYADPSLADPSLPPRVATHPPGPVLYYYLGIRALGYCPGLVDRVAASVEERYARLPGPLSAELGRGITPWAWAEAEILGLVLTLLGALLPLPAYALGRLLHSQSAGLMAALTAAVIPSLAVFIPSIDGVAAVLALTAVVTWLLALRHGGWWPYALAGLAFIAALFWSWGLGAIAVPMLATTLPLLRDPAARSRVLGGSLIFLGTMIGLSLLAWVAFGYSLPRGFEFAMFRQKLEMTVVKRHYLPWLPGNLYDMLVLMGPPLWVGAWAAWPLRRRLSQTARNYVLGTAVALGLVWLSGSTLGEVGRIWLFLMGLMVPGAALALAELPPTRSRPLLALVVLSQSVLAVLLHIRLVFIHP